MIVKSDKETQKIAGNFAKEMLDAPLSRSAFVIALKGDLGGGKTTFVQGLAKGLGVKENVLSPTFNIYKRYEIKNEKYRFLYHFDCYRIEKAEEMEPLGFKEIISNPQNIVAIEWAENIKKILPQNTKWINFKFIDDTTRSIDI